MNKTVKSVNKFSEKIDRFIYKHFFLRKKRAFVFNYVSQGLRNGSAFKELILSLTNQMNDKFLYASLMKTLDEIEKNGLSEIEAMYKIGFIDESEKIAIENISKDEPYKAYDFLLNKHANQDNLKWGIGMLFVPVMIVLIGYIIFQPELKALTEELLAPVNNLSTKAIEVPNYFNDRSVFTYYLLGVIGVVISLFAFIRYLKANNPKILFTIFRIYEREFVVNNFSIMLSLLKSGAAPIKAIEILADNKNDVICKKIFNEILVHQKLGDKTIASVLSEYNMDIATLAYIRSGEDNNALVKLLETALSYNEMKYNKLTASLTKYLSLAGEIILAIAVLIPIIDIINVTTVGTLSFQI